MFKTILSKIKKHMTPVRVKATGVAVALVLSGVMGTALINSVSASPVSTPNCDDNAIVYCGASSVSSLINKYDNGDGHNKDYTIHDIYNWFGISSSDVSSMSSDAVSGYVTKSGDVYAGNTLVATNALTGGREYISGSATQKYGATTFYTRAPSVSFLDNELSAMVDMKNGVFQFAILNSCGNAVKATPKKPAYTISKEVRVKGSSSYQSSVTAMAGTTVQYRITVSSTGQVPVDNVTVHDTLPAHITYTAGTLEGNGSGISSADASKFFGSGIVISKLNNGSQEVYTFDAVVGPGETYSDCTPETLNNEGYISAPGLSGEQSGAKVNKECQTPPAPSIACTGLTLTPGTADSEGNVPYTLVATGTVSNATITGYAFVFGDGSTKTVTTGDTSADAFHTYAPGSYNASVSVLATANGKNYTVTSDNCTGSVKVNTPPAPQIACDDLTLDAGSTDTAGNVDYTLKATGSVTNATITGYTFDFGDSSTKTVTTSDTSATVDHSYAPGSYTAKVSVLATANGKTYTVTSDNCSGKVTVNTPPTAAYACDELSMTPGTADSQGNVPYSLTATAQASNATITGYTFDFGDNSQTQTVTTGDTSTSVNHTYAPGSYTAQVTVTVELSDGTSKQVTSDGCSANITVTPPTCTSPTTGQTYPEGSAQCQPAPTCTSPTTGETYPVGAPECQPAPTCTSPTTGQTYPEGSAQCVPPTTTLPNTGPGDITGLFSGVTLSGAGVHRLMMNRRARKSFFKK